MVICWINSECSLYLLQSACRLRLSGFRDELKHVDNELKRLEPELRRVRIPVQGSHVPASDTMGMQPQSAYDSLKEQINALQSVIHDAEDVIFASFCERIGVDNIREYEERQLKAAQEESVARLQYETQIARLTHLWVSFLHVSYQADPLG